MFEVSRVRIALSALSLVVLLPAAASAATTVYVSPDGLCGGNVPCVTTIQAGVEAAGGGASTVFVFPGTYAESVDLSLMGTGPGAGGAADLALIAVDATGTPAAGLASVDPAAGESFFNSVTPFPFSVEIRGFNVTSPTTDAIDLEGTSGSVIVADVLATGAFYDGVDVRADGDITLSNVTSTGNGNDGFQIEIEGTGDLAITDCVATDNGFPDDDTGDDDGFSIQLLDGSIEITRARAERNGGSGFEIRALPGGKIPSVRITGSTALFNDGNGFQIEDSCDTSPQGPSCDGFSNMPIVNVTILDTMADDNGGDGFELEAAWTDDLNEPIPTVEMRRIAANRNGRLEGEGGNDGVEVQTGDPNSEVAERQTADVIVEDIVASGNAGDGVQLEGRDGIPSRMRDASLTRVTTEDNGSDGIEVFARGDVVLTDIETHRNGFESGERDGIEVNNGDADARTIIATRIRAIGNAGEGVDLQAIERVEARFIEARDNGSNNDGDPQDGLQIDQGTPFVLPGPTPTLGAPDLEVVVSHCVLTGNSKDGLNVDDPEGTIVVSDCDINGNGGDGLDFDADGSVSSASASLTRITASGNGDDGIDGSSNGMIDGVDLCASGNTGDGIVIKEVGGPLLINSSAALGNRYGLALAPTAVQTVSVALSDLSGNLVGGAVNELAGLSVAASANYWGAASGPTHPNNPGGTGDAVFDMFSGTTGTIDFSGFSDNPFSAGACPQRVSLVTDLSITKTDGVTVVVPGGVVQYTIVASNAGPADAPNVQVNDPFPPELTCSWTSAAAGGASGNTNGSGDLADVLDLPAGSSVTYSVGCTVSPVASGVLSNTATIASVVSDPNLANNSATDDDTVIAEGGILEIPTLGHVGLVLLALLLAVAARRRLQAS